MKNLNKEVKVGVREILLRSFFMAEVNINFNNKPEKKRLSPVVDKKDIVKSKKGLAAKFKETFIKEDLQDVGDYILNDCIIPGFKDLILNTLSMMFFQEAFRGRSRYGYDDYRRNSRSRRSYDDYYRDSRDDRRRRDRRDSYDNYKVDYKDIVLTNRDAAERIVRILRSRIEQYGSASIGDLFDLVEISGSSTDEDWGWERVNDIGIRRVSDGFLIDVTDARYIK